MEHSESLTLREEQMNQADHFDPASIEQPREGLSLKVTRFLRLCWQRRRMVFGILVVGISISLAKAKLEHNRYTSTTTFIPPDSSSSFSNLMGMMGSSSSAASFGSQMLGLETPGELYLSVLQSRNVLDSLINRFDLAHYYDAHLMVEARNALEGDTVTALDRKSGVITISVTVKDPVLAANIAQGYVAELNRVLTEASNSSARRERIFLEGRVKDVKQQLDETSKALSQFSTRSGAIDIPNQARSMVDAGLRLQTELISGRSQLAAMRQTYSEDNPRVRALEAGNAELERQINAMGGLNQSSGSNPDSKNSTYPSAKELPALGLTYYDLERKVQVQQALWEALTRQYEVAKVEEAEQTPSARVLDVADVPEKKSGPARSLIVMIGAVLSLLVACIAVVAQALWEAMDPQEEPKKLILDIAHTFTDRRRWYWSLPGIRGFRGRYIG